MTPLFQVGDRVRLDVDLSGGPTVIPVPIGSGGTVVAQDGAGAVVVDFPAFTRLRCVAARDLILVLP